MDNIAEYYGKLLTVKYQELTSDGIPRFPVGISFRDYE
jgi:DNA ligase-1